MAEDGDDVAFVYLGGEQVVPEDVTHVIIDRSVKIIPKKAFQNREELVSVKFHDGVEVIEMDAFSRCASIRRLKMIGVREVGQWAFYNCVSLTDVEFGNLEIIQSKAFFRCPIKSINMKSVRTIEYGAFAGCKLTVVEMHDVERIHNFAFVSCLALRRIAIPLRDDIFHLPDDQYRYTQFERCENLTTVDIVGGIHKIISSLLLDCWRDEVKQEINRINQVLPNTSADEKAGEIQQWIQNVLRRMTHFRNEHRSLLKEATTLLNSLSGRPSSMRKRIVLSGAELRRRR